VSSAPPSPDPTPSPEVIEAAAAAWLSLRDRGLSAAEPLNSCAGSNRTRNTPPSSPSWSSLERFRPPRHRRRASPPAAPDADALAPRPRAHRHPALAWVPPGLAAAALVALAFVTTRAPRHTAETAVGAFQKFDLPDGSVAQLNTDSAIDTDFTATERRVRVVRGEVFFNVTKDPARPFIVVSGPVAVRAVGTAFNVRQRAAAVEVLVTEGRVRVDDVRLGQSLLPVTAPAEEPPLLVAGERAVVVDTTAAGPAQVTVAKVNAPEQQRSLAWQERRLELRRHAARRSRRRVQPLQPATARDRRHLARSQTLQRHLPRRQFRNRSCVSWRTTSVSPSAAANPRSRSAPLASAHSLTA